MSGAARLASRSLRLFPFFRWVGELRDPKTLARDALAGSTVALVLIPQSMAYAQLAGLPAYYGLYAAFLPPIVAALFGSSRQLATGPVAVVSLLTAAALEPIATGGGPGYIGYAVALSLLVGLFQLALGLLRLGVVVNFLSHPVIIGFTNAAAIIIATSQLDKIFGVRVEKAELHYQTVWNTVTAAVGYTHAPTLAIATGALAALLVLRRFAPRWPNVLIVVAATALLSYLIEFERLKTVEATAIESSAVQDIIAERSRLKREMPRLDREIAVLERRLAQSIERHGVNDSRSLAVQHALDSVRLRRERRMKSVQADLDEIKKVRFEFVPADGGGRFHLLGHAPEGHAPAAGIWRLRAVNDDGAVVMNGGGNVVGTVPRGLPSFVPPRLDPATLTELLSAAIAISLIGFMEAISIAKAMATKTRQRLDANQELVGQGLGNIVGSLFQSYPTSGSFSRSAVNLSAGAVTGFASVVTGLLVVVTLLWLTPLLYHLPQATLAAVIMLAVVGLINIRAVKHAWHANRNDGVVAIATFVLTLAFAPHLDKGILIGAGLALVLYLYRTMQPRVAVLARHPDGTLRDAEVFGLQTCENISMIRFDGSLYFANTSYFEDKVMERVAFRPDLRSVIVVGDGINQVDATGEEMLSRLAERLGQSGITLLFTGLKTQVLDVFHRTGLYDKLGADRFFRTEDQALDHVWETLGEDHAVDCPLNIVCQIPGAQKA